MAGKLWLSQNKINLIPTPTPSPRKALHYSDDTPYWHPILYSPLFILYWRRQIPLHSPRKSCDPLNPATPSPPSPRKALYYSDNTPYWQSILYSPLFILPPPSPPQGENTDWSQSKAFIYQGDSPSNFWLTIQQTVRRFIFISENHYCLMLQLK